MLAKLVEFWNSLGHFSTVGTILAQLSQFLYSWYSFGTVWYILNTVVTILTQLVQLSNSLVYFCYSWYNSGTDGRILQQLVKKEQIAEFKFSLVQF